MKTRPPLMGDFFKSRTIKIIVYSYSKCANKSVMRTQGIKQKYRLYFTTLSSLLIILASLPAFGQSSFEVNLNWKEPVVDQNKSFLYFEGAGYNEKGFPIYGDIFENQKIEKAHLTNIITTPLPPEWSYLIEKPNELPLDFAINITNKVANSGCYAVYEIFPIRITNGIPEILISATINLSLSKSEVLAVKSDRSSSSSVLANGNWVKVGTSSNGMYRITFSELQNSGLIGGSVASTNLQLFGNGGGMLPEENNKFRYDDLQQNAIEVIDGGDGNFDNGDYILFYGQGANQWTFNWNDSSKFNHINNVYADTNFYYVTVGTTPGLRIGNRASLGGGAGYTTTTGDGYIVNETDRLSLTNSGREWMGDYFNFVNSYDYDFNLIDINTSDSIRATMRIAGRCVLCNQTMALKNGSTTLVTSTPAQCSSSYTAPIANFSTASAIFPVSSSSLTLTAVRTSIPSGAEAWMDYIEINYRKNLNANGTQSVFSDRKSLGQTNAKFTVSNANSSHQIWDVTNRLNPVLQSFNVVGSNGEFQADMSDTLHSFVVFNPNNVMGVSSINGIPNQDLHALTETGADFIIVTHPAFMGAAQDLANFHASEDGMNVHVVTINQIYNEYSSGKQDVAAIRDYIKMYYDKHPVDYPKYVLMFGDGSYDYKPYLDRVDFDNTNFVPAFETTQSFDRGGGSYCSDDFYALLDDDEGISGLISLTAFSNIDVGVGRIPCRTADEAQGVVNKIKYYATNVNCMRDWRNYVTLISDDMEAPWEANFLTGSELVANQINGINKVWNIDKIYLDSYQQVSNAGQRYPEAEIAIYNRANKGSLIINYIGHGGETGITAERVIQIDNFVELVNENNLPAFCTATCTFTRFDNPEFNSAGEVLMQLPDRGAIGLFSTIRPISIVPTWNAKFYDAAYTRMSNGEMPRMGDIIRLSKQPNPTNDFGEANILLFGDPALRLAYPDIKVVTDSINGMYADTTVGSVTDTLMASQLVTISGHIEDLTGAFQGSYDGDLYTTIFDKASNLTTLGNDGGNQFNYTLRKNIIFKGKSTIVDGRFTFQFQVPLDINYLMGQGKISYYATDNSSVDAHGYYMNFNIGGSENNCSPDSEGPQVEVFINDTNFQEMGITQSATTLVVKVTDESGINTTGLGIGHDLQAIIDGDVQNPIILNDYYTSDNNSYTSGTAEYFITGLSTGFHTVEVQVWDGCNNQAQKTLNFAVTNAEEALINFKAYPNPFSDAVTLAFEHNFEGKNVVATIDISDLAGHTSKTWTKSYVPEGNRDVSITWDGTDDGGVKMASGLYICRIMMQDDQGNQASGCCKLVLVY